MEQKHMTVKRLRDLLDRLGDVPDDAEVRFYMSQERRWGGGEFEDTYGVVTASIVSLPDDEGDTPYLGLRIVDTGGTW